MRIDLYMRVVLTAIAAALTWIAVALTPFGISVTAQTRNTGYERVLIAGWIDEGGREHGLSGAAPLPGLPVVTLPQTRGAASAAPAPDAPGGSSAGVNAR
jgi:hypothetical protein